ncbi:arylamine N-acetyltransferase family protein [Chryseobacterium populi]|uniref:Arylamine N-acetyltransferase n=1 Tax=Chryseobacterium populi TaxID=1144316 RepID=J2T7Z2_9FLAO|nr:arylamine N-acetyltransferase [Chryseobacterium populi]EJL74187.1 arylamine N-acetyltransferase [Chryseobacterium populi]
MENTELKKYFERIHFTGNAEADLETLNSILELHPQYISFENIDSYTNLVPQVDIENVFQKLVVENRGGYCYEQNVLLKNVLETIGFQVTVHLGRVFWRRERKDKAARTHMLLVVTLNGEKYLADSGFGTVTLTAPLVLHSKDEQTTPNEKFQITQNGTHYILSLIAEEKMPIYGFTLEEAEQSDVEVANWFIATHPSSTFKGNLIITKVDRTARYTIHNKSLNIRYNNGFKENIDISNDSELFTLLENAFNIRVESIKDKELLIRKFNRN